MQFVDMLHVPVDFTSNYFLMRGGSGEGGWAGKKLKHTNSKQTSDYTNVLVYAFVINDSFQYFMNPTFYLMH